MKKTSLALLAVLFAVGFAFGQRTITGTVTDADAEPLIGATVLAKGSTTGTTTDIDGKFELEVPEEFTTLIISYTGFLSQEIELGASDVIDVVLKSSATQLDEVVVVGYGTQIKSTLTGNIAKVSGEELENTPVTTVEQALQGKSPGVYIEAVNGKPGGQVRVRIRGASSISANNQPLFVVDGIPITVESQNLSGAALNPLADLNFNDIESVDILKDASAAAIYGSRAANGVIIITTKQGKAGKTKIDLDYQYGFSNPTGRREFLNAAEYVELFSEAAINLDEIEGNVSGGDDFNWLSWVEGRFDRYSGPSDWRTLETDTDWQDLAFRENATSQQANLSLSGGDEKTKFYTSLGWNEQEGLLVGNSFNRMSGRLNLDHAALKKLNIGINMSLSRTFSDQVANDNAFSTPLQLIAQSPLTPARNTTGAPFESGRTYLPGELFDRPIAVYYNGLIDTEEAQREITSFRTIANGYARYELIEGLKLNGELGVDIYNLRDDAFFGSKTFGGQASNGEGTSRTVQIVNYNTKVYANFLRTFGESHNFDLTAGFEFQKSERNRNRTEGQEFAVDDLRTIASAANITVGESDFTHFSFESYFARVNYNFDRKYLLTLSGRIDGSSRFGANNRYGFFPAAAVGWVISEEDFLKGSNTLSFLKLRGSYGQIGNAELLNVNGRASNFASLGLFNGEGYNGTPGLQPTQIPNPNLTWETTTQIDIGLDFGFIDNRVSGEIDFYFKQTEDLLLDVPVPATSGFSSQTQNIGAVENTGIEFLLNTNNLVGDFKWNTSLNFAYNQNEVTKLAEGQDIIDPGSSRAMNVVQVGQPIGAFYGAEYAGVDPQTGDALFYTNAEGAGRETTTSFSEAEFITLGNPNPDVIAGVTNSFSWKGFDLNISFQGVFGNELHNVAGGFMSAQAAWFDNQTADQLDRWQQPGDVTDVPKAIFLGGNGDQVRSSRYLSDGSFVRLKNVTFGYNFPNSFFGSSGIRSLRLYVSGQNLATFTDYDGWDPEVSTDAFVDNTAFGQDFYAAPQPKTIVFGIKAGF